MARPPSVHGASESEMECAVKTALKIAAAAEKSRFTSSARRGVALRLVAPSSAPPQSTALRSVRSGGHERVLRALDRLALFGMVVAVALLPVLAAGQTARQPVAVEAVSNDEAFGFFRALSALGYAIWRRTPSRPVSNPSQQDHGAPAPRHFSSTN
jgi:hypothetical protein